MKSGYTQKLLQFTALLCVVVSAAPATTNEATPAQTVRQIETLNSSTVVTSEIDDEAENLQLGCPSPGDAPRGIRVWIHVPKWCDGPRVRGQTQLKIQVKIKNTGKRNLDISRTHVRLLVRKFNRRKWSPPKVGQKTVERPFKTRFRGESVWAIPPNADGAYDPSVNGFATHWRGTTLAPGETYRPVNRKHGTLVYYVPSKSRQSLQGVVGLAYVDGRDVIVSCPPTRWDRKVAAASF